MLRARLRPRPGRRRAHDRARQRGGRGGYVPRAEDRDVPPRGPQSRANPREPAHTDGSGGQHLRCPGLRYPARPARPAQLQQLVAREQAIATAVDARYARLVPAVTSDPVFDGDLLNELQPIIVDHGTGHAAAFAVITDPLAGLAPGDYLRATRRQAADSFEERLLAASDRGYRLIIDALKDQFATAGTFSSLAVSAMRVMDDTNRLLAQRGLLPPFTSP